MLWLESLSTDYLFGLAFGDANVANKRVLYNGKELEDYTIGSSYLGTLDYGARHYDARIARWTVPDPMEEKYFGLTGYNYCSNSPISLIDPTGSNWYSYVDEYGIKKYEFSERQLSLEEREEKGYTDMGYTFTDPETGLYYSLFGTIVNIFYNNKISLEYELYKRIDELIIDYSQYSIKYKPFSQEVDPIPHNSFYFYNLKKASRRFNYDGRNFTSDRESTVFRSLEVEENSNLYIGMTPKDQEEVLNGILGGYIKGHLIVLFNDNKWDVIVINYKGENAKKVRTAWDNLFKK